MLTCPLHTIASRQHHETLRLSKILGVAEQKDELSNSLDTRRAAATKLDQTGTADYVLATSKTDKPAVMYGNIDYYQNPQRRAIPQWSNQFAVAAWAEWLTFNPMPVAQQIKVPTLCCFSHWSLVISH